MTMKSNPNRDRNHSADRFENQRKQSGDQHVLPPDDTMEAPHRPHRVSREDMHKLEPRSPGRDESGTP